MKKHDLYWIIPTIIGLVVTAIIGHEHSDVTLAIFGIDDALLGGLIGGVGSIGSGLLGKSAADNAAEQAQRLAQESVAEYEKIGIPTIEAQRLALEKFKSAGQLTPELEQALITPDTEMKQISVSPEVRDAQLQALNQLKQISQGGQTISDKAALEEGLGEVAARQRGSREAILQQMRNRGMSGSGMELAAQLQGQQAATQNANQVGLNAAAQAQNRALQALMQQGQLAGQVRTQEFGEKSKSAEAQDLINRFNTNQRADVQQRNIANLNQAQAANLQNAQNIMNQNTQLANQEQQANKALLQQQFQNQMQLNQAKANARAGQSSNIMDAGKTSANIWGGVAQGLGKLGSGIMDYGIEQKAPELKKKKEEE